MDAFENQSLILCWTIFKTFDHPHMNHQIYQLSQLSLYQLMALQKETKMNNCKMHYDKFS